MLYLQPKETYRAVGLMSGTSADAVDAALVEIKAEGERVQVRLMAFAAYPFPPALREEVLALGECGTTAAVCRLNFALGEVFAAAALAVLERAKVAPSEVDFIGSHGQTVYHCPPVGNKPGSTLQLGEPSVIAERTGITTVAEFRYRDLAAGGQGAPLVPYVDWLLFRDPGKSRAVQNIGGIANVTYLPAGGGLEEVLAFDTGPGNMLIDGLVRALTQGQETCDWNGRQAARGRVEPGLLRELLAHPFFAQVPPKSTGREAFGEPMVTQMLAEGRRRGLKADDLIATATALTVETIAQSYERFLLPRGPVEEVILSGGGAANPTLRRMLKARLGPIPVRLSDEFGLPSETKEALVFAVLAWETLRGRPSNVPSATGAKRPVVLGKIVPGTGNLGVNEISPQWLLTGEKNCGMI
ncbi:MAG TPA: anhydro-N-acetylmuramic acid kinase [Armatimonadetes bacterium]|nr:anhydro-N-acetylmuramic acid kinase [Armatimonadota bacterium]